MALEAVRAFLAERGMDDRVRVFDVSSATVPLAAQALGCAEKQIAKTMSFLVSGAPVILVCAGNVKTDNTKFKQQFHEKARMIPAAEVEGYVGHGVGGVCPFALRAGIPVYLDVSLRQNEIVYPAAGSANSAVRLTVEELERLTSPVAWVDVCKPIEG